MQLDIAYSPTPQAGAAAPDSTAAGRARRRLLALMDGRRTVVELLPTIKLMGLKVADVYDMADAGWLAPRRSTVGVPAVGTSVTHG